MKDLVQYALFLLKRKESFALVTIIGLEGSAPGGIGSHMIVRRDGGIFGTIGGGAMEATVQESSREALRDNRMRILNLDLDQVRFAETEMACGGQIEILIDYIDAQQKSYLDICSSIINSLYSGQCGWLITFLADPGPSVRMCLIKSDGEIVGKMPHEASALLKQLDDITQTTVLRDLQVLIEPFTAPRVAYVFGAGHVARKLVPLLNMVGFRTVVIDDRAEYANEKRFTTANQIIIGDMPNIFSQIKPDAHSYIVIITRGHPYDQKVLAQALKGPAAYIGMIGSKAKRTAIYNNLLKDGFTQGDLKRVHSPIGLNIQAQSPEEIAVSITAEMIAVRAQGHPKSHQCMK